MQVPFVNLKPAIKQTEPLWRANLAELHERSNYILGAQVEAFEREFAVATGAKQAIGTGSGCGAIEICLRELGITSPGQRVLTSALTAPFTAVAIQAAGATPTFADIDPDTLQIDPEDAANRVDKRTAALLPVHLYGQPCEVDQFANLARERKLALIQDACQAHGARFADREFTKYSSHVCYSFYPTKNLGGLGDGGAVVTNSAKVASRLRMIRDGGRKGDQVSYIAGSNSRLDEMQACYLRAFLSRLKEWNDRRARIARIYDELLAKLSGIRLVKRSRESVHHLYVVRAARRDKLREYLANKGITTGVHYPVPLHLNPAFTACGLKRGDLPHAERASKEVLSLPVGPFHTEMMIERVASGIKFFYSF